MMTRTLSTSLVATFALVGAASAGHVPPPFIDGCQSADGRFVVTAERTSGTKPHGPNAWRFVWKDTKTGDSKVIDNPKGVQGGHVAAQLFVAPDGDTFALFNHVTMWAKDKTDDHAATHLPMGLSTEEWRSQELFSRRVVVYRKDGTVLRELAVNDILAPEEWPGVSLSFYRVHWCVEYPALAFKSCPRPAYALCRVSPDYTVLEVLAPALRGVKDSKPRPVRISLTDGVVLPEKAWPTGKAKVPVPVAGTLTTTRQKDALDAFVPSLDPVRTPGKFPDPE